MFLLWVFALPLIRGALGVDERTALRWVGMGLALLAGVAACMNFALRRIVMRLGAWATHAALLLIAAIGFVMIGHAHQPALLLCGYVVVGFGWASLANLPYKIILEGVEEHRIDAVLARFNLTIVVPQISLALSFAWLFVHIGARDALNLGAGAMAAAGLILALAALATSA